MEVKGNEERVIRPPRVVAVSVNGGSKSKHIVHWALQYFGDYEHVLFKLIHVFSKITGVPTPMGNLIPFSQVRDDVVAAYKQEIEWQKKELMLPYQKMITQKKVLAEVVLVESDEIWKAIAKEIAKESIIDLVIGASSKNMFARKFKGQSMSSLISECTPSFCSVYVVSKGKLGALRASDTEIRRDSSRYGSTVPDSTFTSSRFSTSSLESGSTSEFSFASSPDASELNGTNHQNRNASPVCISFITSSATDVDDSQSEEGLKLKLIKENEDLANVLEGLEKERFDSAKREERERFKALKEEIQREEGMKSARDGKEKHKLKEVVAGHMNQFQTFTWAEIVSATNFFNVKLKIGEGSYGTMYKCRLHQTPVAIKVLHSKVAKGKLILQELETLSKIRHPNLLSLIGACPENGCLVYEYMKNGSLQDHLFQKIDTPPIPWYERFRIVWEVASALSFLHNNNPNPIIHGGLKPANILLDQNLVSKISDTGLFTILNSDPSTKDDIYDLGIVILQMLTGKPAVGLTQVVESVVKERRLMNILDKDAGKWPFRETAEMALLGVKCTEFRGKDRPDLKTKILPVLERIKDFAQKAKDFDAGVLVKPPNHFICPILMDVMEDPCVASDGYTYDRKAIELWVKDNDTSPTTNFPLANKNLIPNNSLLHAITEWKSKRKLRTDKSRTYSSFSCF